MERREPLHRNEKQEHAGEKGDHVRRGPMAVENVDEEHAQPEHGEGLDDRIDL